MYSGGGTFYRGGLYVSRAGMTVNEGGLWVSNDGATIYKGGLFVAKSGLTVHDGGALIRSKLSNMSYALNVKLKVSVKGDWSIVLIQLINESSATCRPCPRERPAISAPSLSISSNEGA